MEKTVFPARLKSLDPMIELISKSADITGFDEKNKLRIRLASEEALINIIKYAYPGKEGDIEITCEDKGEGLEIEIKDFGIAFDPLSLPEPDIHAPLEERKIGGLGIFLIRKIMDEVRYRRADGRNILTLVKHKTQRSDAQNKMKDPAEIPNTQIPKEESTFKWPLAMMKKEEFKKGDVIFKAGDKADKMFYVKKGAIRLLEINKVIEEGQVIGEMGIFSPFKERTASAVCDQDVEAYTMGRDEVVKFFCQDPPMAIDLIQLSIKRFIENLKAETEARERIESELRIAREIQTSMLPSVFPQKKEFEIFAMMDAAKEVGGDFYDFFFVDDKRLCFVIGDVSGKGVPAALFMAITKTLIKTEARRGLSTDQVLSSVNNILCLDNATCLFVTVFCAILDIETGNLQYCNAGHNPPLIVTRDKAVDFLKSSGGLVVGVMENCKCENMDLRLDPGDTIFLYTDGVNEAMDPDRRMFSAERLRQCLKDSKDLGLKEIIGRMREEIRAFARGAPQSDDITMLAVKYKGA